VDAHIGRIIVELRARKSYAREDWLGLVTSDHRGKGFEHRGKHNEPEVIHSFLIVSGPSAARGKIERPTYLVDVVPTALAHLGVRTDPQWKLDVDAVGLSGITSGDSRGRE